MGKVVGPGSLIIDLTGYANHFPVGGETVMGSSLKIGPGGKGHNQMTAAHRAGAESVIIGCIGKDDLSSIHKNFYAQENMRSDYIKVSDTLSTGAAIIEVDEVSGQNRIIIITGANDEVDAAQVMGAEKEFKDAGAVLCQFETSFESIKATKELAQKYNKPFILNPAPFIDYDKSFYNGIDYVTPNETEVEYITGVHVANTEDAKKAAEKLLAMGVKKAIITLGKNGVYFYDGKKEIHLPCLPWKAVDSTGAGDAFNGGFACAIAEGLDDETALKFASSVSNLSVTKKGSSVSMPQREEVLEVLKKYYNVEL